MASSINASTSGAGGVITTADNTGILNLQTGGTTAVTVDASQNVGIGTTSPFSAAGYKSLTINGSTTGILAIQANGTNSCYLYADGGAFNIKGVQNIPMDFYTNDTQRMRITSSGKLVMASTTDGLIGSIQAGVTANTASTNAIIIAAATSNGPYPIGARGESTNQGLVGFFNSSDTAIASITKSGNSVAYNTSSDYRLKENIAPMTGALNKVLLLKPVTYTWKEDGLTGQGFIAHELQEIVPDAVTGEKDAVETYTDKDGIEQTRIKPQGIDTSFLVATLTAAIQEQQTIINDLKARIETLEAK